MNIEKEDFTCIYNTHAPKVFRLCMQYASGDEDLAKEWQQETFIKVWNHRKSFQAKSSISTWIYRIAVNICLGDLRNSKKEIQIDEGIRSIDSTTEENEKQENQIKKMHNCINKLTQINKAIIVLELEEVPQATIAEMLGFSHGSLRTRLSRIRNSLLKCITNGK
ncbi:RNA polymerase sigma factor [Marinigracilibium pacificum]|uniref:Sigma-70 family RNA polymerase sigma factor n=1 Tax=Marinigracilibium pacificum TaxID=2729599 RepID=A0A848J8S4_9BACT|nr:sigma-70 family RNA polymerase sigma factor [Marinigracilibium pacificum]NMM50779.1 sigma-70 family RNA polymerase sigma factor [Marinigracilibium pacificum]